MNYSNDDNEIDLDSDNDIHDDDTTVAIAADHDHMKHHRKSDDEVSLPEPKVALPQQYKERDVVVSTTTTKTEPRSATEATSDTTVNISTIITASATTAGNNSSNSMKLRLNLLKQKINQAKLLNQQAVREEGEATTAAIMGNNSSNKKSHYKQQKHTTYEDTMAQQLANQYSSNNNIDSKDMKDLVQPAYVNMKKQNQQQEQREIQQYAINDYHNPEGQYRNFQRNMNHLLATTRDHKTDSDTTSAGLLYDPTDVRNSHTVKNERDGAHRIALELQRRYEKRDKKQLKRKQEQIRNELNNTTSSSSTSNTGGTGINLRNQKFNEKIARTYNSDTAEIRHNLERGTAL